MTSAGFFRPEWPAPASVGALCTTRVGGSSVGAYQSNNLALHVGDRPADVEESRRQLMAAVPMTGVVQWLEQVHGNKIVEAGDDGFVRTADACYSRARQIACAVLTADCLPVLLCDAKGQQVAAVHAGWRSLAAGILRNALATFDRDIAPIYAWLGPAIGPNRFEVGVDVIEAMFENAKDGLHADQIAAAIRPASRPLHFYTDLYALAKAELESCGVSQIYGGGFCTYTEADRFYSYRRDGAQTGRMASIIWIK